MNNDLIYVIFDVVALSAYGYVNNLEKADMLCEKLNIVEGMETGTAKRYILIPTHNVNDDRLLHMNDQEFSDLLTLTLSIRDFRNDVGCRLKLEDLI